MHDAAKSHGKGSMTPNPRVRADVSPALLWLAAILLGGLALNALFGMWWADPVAALVMLPIIVKERIEALRGETCENGCH